MPKSRIPSLNWLRVFEAAARTGSFARAAELLGMSPPGVSQQIKALEGHLEKPLFIRQAHSVHLTEAGEAFLPSVQQALLSVESAAAGLFGTRYEEPLYLQVTLLFALGWLNPRLPEFTDTYPNIRLRVNSGIYPEDFTRGCDMQIAFDQAPTTGMQSDRLLGEKLYPVARPEIAALIKRPEDLTSYRLIDVATHKSSWLQLLAHAGVTNIDDVSFDFTDSTVMSFSRAMSGKYVALARSPASNGLQDLYGLVPCLDGLSIPGTDYYWLIYPVRDGLRPPARKFREWILKRLPKDNA